MHLTPLFPRISFVCLLRPSSPMPSALSIPVGPSLPSRPPAASRSVAVIGAGAAGLVAARELRREGHRVVVFERGGSVGGTWIYTPSVESDPLGLDPSREIVHSSLYASLRTNLPRECMGFLDFPFVAVEGEARDPRRFPGHREVLLYLEDFARRFDLYRSIRFRTEVVRVEMEEKEKWTVRSRSVCGDESEDYDAVMVCNGHYTEPRIADIPGIDAWPGKQIHSHNYRAPEPFHGQVVVIIGSAASAVDISRDISRFAKEVRIASISAPDGTPLRQPGYDNMWLHSMIECTCEDGTVLFLDGTSVHVDVIMHCTGYKYHFPFFEGNTIVDVDESRVAPLYKHIFPPSLAPFISFIGLPFKVVPFPLFELQSKWVAGVLSGRLALPTEEEMMEDAKNSYSEMEAIGRPRRYTHKLSNYQFEYDDWLAAKCGHQHVEEWRKQMYAAVSQNRKVWPESYRDEWDDDHLISIAHEDFQKYMGV